jgi:hypothetical protein
MGNAFILLIFRKYSTFSRAWCIKALMKTFMQSLLMVNSFLVLPLLFVAFIYSVGAMFLLGQWQLCLELFASLFFFSIAQCVISIFGE